MQRVIVIIALVVALAFISLPALADEPEEEPVSEDAGTCCGMSHEEHKEYLEHILLGLGFIAGAGIGVAFNVQWKPGV